MIYLAILGVLVLWNAFPFVVLYRLPLSDKPRLGITAEVRKACARSLIKAAPKAMFRLIMGFPLVTIPLLGVVLLFVPRKANKLPWLFQWWDNDVSINGDDPAYWAEDYAGVTYYANAHPRSYRARFVWLALRNRASRLSQILGHRWADKKAPTRVWGFPPSGKSQPGWNINEREGVFQLCYGKRVGRFVWELNWGHKVWHKPDGRDVANVVNISFSPGRWVG